MKTLSIALTLLALTTANIAQAQSENVTPRSKDEIQTAKERIRSGESNVIDEIDPFDPNVERQLDMMDQMYEETMNEPALNSDSMGAVSGSAAGSCKRAECAIWLEIVKAKQVANFYRNGKLEKSWKVSTGDLQHTTPNFDTNPNGRIYDKYESTKFPGGGFKNLGNMPYAVFIRGGFAVHGTAAIARLGTRASHGCIRQHPDNAKFFNREVRAQLTQMGGLQNVWITVR